MKNLCVHYIADPEGYVAARLQILWLGLIPIEFNARLVDFNQMDIMSAQWVLNTKVAL